MKIKWLGHASFLITSDKGTKIITDPYTPGGPLTYGEIKESADIVTVSHEHGDHNNAAAVGGKPEVVKGAAKPKGINIKAIPVFHDGEMGKQRGKNTIFCFEVDGMKLCHAGDLGHPLNDKQAGEIGTVDILFVPVGGFYTLDAAGATRLVEQLKPRVVIPMHYKNSRCAYPIAAADDFLKGKRNVKKLDGSEVEFKAGQLPNDAEIVVLKPAL